MTVDQLDTPVAIVDIDKLERNIHEMQEAVSRYKVRLRPHIKSHKIPEIARMQLNAGAVGITCAKVGEAEMMSECGIDDIFIAYPIIGMEKYKRLDRLLDRCKIRVGVESIEGVSWLSDYMYTCGRQIDVVIKVYMGLGRTGVQPGSPTLEFASKVIRMAGLRLVGIFTHEGQVHGKQDHEEGAKLGIETVERFVETAYLLRLEGIEIQEVSIGSTPTMKETASVPGVTEARPGNYVYYDISAVAIGVVPPERCALSVIVTVVSRPTSDRAIVDGGSKVFTSDKHPFVDGHGIIKGIDGIRFDWMNEEHGVLKLSHPSREIHVGDRLEIIPVHACVVSNMWDEIVAVRDGHVEGVWPVRARGKVK